MTAASAGVHSGVDAVKTEYLTADSSTLPSDRYVVVCAIENLVDRDGPAQRGGQIYPSDHSHGQKRLVHADRRRAAPVDRRDNVLVLPHVADHEAVRWLRGTSTFHRGDHFVGLIRRLLRLVRRPVDGRGDV